MPPDRSGADDWSRATVRGRFGHRPDGEHQGRAAGGDQCRPWTARRTLAEDRQRGHRRVVARHEPAAGTEESTCARSTVTYMQEMGQHAVGPRHAQSRNAQTAGRTPAAAGRGRQGRDDASIGTVRRDRMEQFGSDIDITPLVSTTLALYGVFTDAPTSRKTTDHRRNLRATSRQRQRRTGGNLRRSRNGAETRRADAHRRTLRRGERAAANSPRYGRATRAATKHSPPYHEAKQAMGRFWESTPRRSPSRIIRRRLGWARKAVDMLAELCVFEGFCLAGVDDPFELQDFMSRIEFTSVPQQAIQTALDPRLFVPQRRPGLRGRPLIRTHTAESSAAVWTT